MSWSADQRERLAFERKVLRQRMPHFSFYNPTGDTYVEGWQGASRGSRTYKIKLVIPPDYPWDMPDLYVVSPHTLRKRGRGSINAEGLSHSFHTEGNGPGGCVHICHCKSSRWYSSMTIVSVLTKACLWLEAYEAHLATGQSISDFLGTQN